MFILQGNAYATTGIFGPSIFANNGSTANINSKIITLMGIPDGYKGIIADTGGKLYFNNSAPDSFIKINLTGNSAFGIYATDPTSLIQIKSKLTAIISQGDNNTGLFITNDGNIILDQLSIEMVGAESVGIKMNGPAQLSIARSTLNIQGGKSIGVEGGDLSNLSLENLEIVMAGYDSTAILSNNSHVNLKTVSIENRYGIGLEPTDMGMISVDGLNLIDSGKTALLATHQGRIEFYGKSYIKNNADGALISQENGSSIIGNGSMIIDGNVSALDRGTVSLTMENGSILNGTTTVDTTGKVSINLSDSAWKLTGDSSLTNLSILKDGRVYLSDYNGGVFNNHTVLVNGNYHGENGILYFNTVLSDDNSVTDRLIIKGDSSGITKVNVNNIGGTGSYTLNGIELIHVDGKSDGEFTPVGRIAAGAYDYSLVRGQADNNKNWYLSNKKEVLESNHNEDHEQTNEGIKEEVIRPEGGSYMANITAANKLFNLRLADREGRAENSSLWLRQQG